MIWERKKKKEKGSWLREGARGQIRAGMDMQENGKNENDGSGPDLPSAFQALRRPSKAI